MNPVAVEPNIFDGSNLVALKRLTKHNDPQGIKQAAQQFEALFVQMMLKSMREATPKNDDLMGSDQQRMYESLLDQQLSQVMATRGRGMGLATMIEKQMTQAATVPDLDGATRSIPLKPADPSFPLSTAGKRFILSDEARIAPQEFLNRAVSKATNGASSGTFSGTSIQGTTP